MPDLDKLVDALGGTAKAEALIRAYEGREEAKWRERYEEAMRTVDRLREQRDSARKQAEHMRETAVRYGQHDSDCPKYHAGWATASEVECTCRLTARLETVYPHGGVA